MFDSGFGGLTVARALIDLLPDEDLVYFGDTGRYPYGPRPLEEVREFARQITRLLIDRHNVKMVERGETHGEDVHVLAERLLAPVRDARVDALLLGCTHYPFLAHTIGDVMGRDVVLVSSADETAFEVRSILGETGLVRRSGRGTGKGRHTFVSSGDVEWFKRLGGRLLGPEGDDVEAWAWR